MKRFMLALILCGVVTFYGSAQEFHMPQASPHVKSTQEFSTSYIKLDYSRPSVNDRTIFGDLIPYGELWRTGANESTKISFGEDVSFNGKEVKAGTYSLYTIPGKKMWGVILNKATDNWGKEGFNDNLSVAKTSISVETTDKLQESFEIRLENLTKNSADLVLAWENSKITIPVTADNNDRIMAYLNDAMDSDNPPYAKAASYFLTSEQNLDQALKYADKAIEKNPDAYYLYWTKAQILQKVGKHDRAVVAAKKAAEKAEDHPAYAKEYEKHYQTIKNAE